MSTEAKPLSKTDFLAAVAEKSGLAKKDVSTMFDAMTEVIRGELSSKGPGTVSFPGLVKINVVVKEAKSATTKPNPFKPGEMMTVKAKPATRVVKVRALKSLKDMV